MSHRQHRRRGYEGQRRRDAILARYQATLRACCPTAKAEAHTPTCERQPGRCADKTPMTRDAALWAIAGLTGWGAYRCHSCGFHHIGHARRQSEVVS